MAAADDSNLATTVLEQLERNAEQAWRMSEAWGKAATRVWTESVRSTFDAFDAAKTGPQSKRSAKGDDNARMITEAAERSREFAERAWLGYSEALREGASVYAQAVAQSSSKPGTSRPKRKSASKSRRAARAKS